MKKFFFIINGDKEGEEIKNLIVNEINKLNNFEPKNNNYDLYINVVKNKEDVNLGYSYGWISDENLYNALIGLNLDGTPREKITVKKNNTENTNEVNLNDNWADYIEEEEREIEYLPPLITFDNLEISKCEIEKNENLKNKIFIKHPNINKDIDEIKDFFTLFDNDKRSNRYPIFEHNKDKNILTIQYSTYEPNLASFVILLCKKIFIDDTLYFFSQSKVKNYY